MKTDWRRARDKKNKLCQDFFRSRQKEKKQEGFQKPKLQKQTEETLFWKKPSKKEIGKKGHL